MKNIIISFCFLFSVATFAADDNRVSPEVADLLVKGDFKKASKKTADNELKKNLEKLLNMNKLVAESYKPEIGKEISIYIRSEKKRGILAKIKGKVLYVKIKNKQITATWPVKTKSLPIEFRMERINIPDSAKNIYFGAKAFHQKNFPAAMFYFKNAGSFSESLLTSADKQSKYIMSLSAACRSGNLEKTRKLLKKGADANGQIFANVKNKKTGKLEKKKSTILIETIKSQKVEIIKYLIKNGADINKANSAGVTPLMFAIMYFPEKLEIVDFMLNHQAKTNVKDKKGNTPLTGAVGAGRAEAVKLLIKHNTNVNEQNRRGVTPLMIAVATNNTEIFKLLLKKGADIKKHHPRGWTVLQLNRSRMDPEIKAILDEISPPKIEKSPNFPTLNLKP